MFYLQKSFPKENRHVNRIKVNTITGNSNKWGSIRQLTCLKYQIIIPDVTMKS